jgi:hypothetical protein
MGGYQASFGFNLMDTLSGQSEHIAECIDYPRRNDVWAMASPGRQLQRSMRRYLGLMAEVRDHITENFILTTR